MRGVFDMFSRCCLGARPRPVCGGAPIPVMPIQAPIASAIGLERPVIPIGGNCAISHGAPQVVVEPAIVAAPNVFHHHQNVQHIQPVITQDVHHYHTHHKYVVQEQKKADEVLNHAHGLCGTPVTQPAQPCKCGLPPMQCKCGFR